MALVIRDKSKIGNFEVSTGLFESYFETRVFHNVGDGKVPRKISDDIATAISSLVTVDDVRQEFSDEPAVMSYAFVDADTVHAAVCSVVRWFAQVGSFLRPRIVS